MDFVNRAYAQAAELFRSMSPAARIAAGLLLAVIVVSLVYLFQYQVTSGDEFLLDGRPFSASEMTSIEAAFAQAGLSSSIVVGNRIRIPRGQKAAYLAAMADASALPADFYKYFDDAVSSENPFASNRSLELKHSNAKMKEAVPVAVKYMNDKGVQPTLRASVMIYFAKLADRSVIETLEPFRDDKTVVSNVRFNNEALTVPMRDVALGVSVQIAGLNAGEFGFDRLKTLNVTPSS